MIKSFLQDVAFKYDLSYEEVKLIFYNVLRLILCVFLAVCVVFLFGFYIGTLKI